MLRAQVFYFPPKNVSCHPFAPPSKKNSDAGTTTAYSNYLDFYDHSYVLTLVNTNAVEYITSLAGLNTNAAGFLLISLSQSTTS